MYLGNVLSKMLRGYTDAAISVTSGLLTAFSKFAVQVSAAGILKCGVNVHRLGMTNGQQPTSRCAFGRPMQAD